MELKADSLKRKKQNWYTLSQIHHGKREINQINKIKNEKGKVTTDSTEIPRVVRDYYEQLHANTMENLEEMRKILRKV